MSKYAFIGLYLVFSIWCLVFGFVVSPGIAIAAKQSLFGSNNKDCFVVSLLAMTFLEIDLILKMENLWNRRRWT